MTFQTEEVGFESPISRRSFSRQRHLGIEFIATLALAISLIIAATAVSIGMARAQVLHAAAGGAPYAAQMFPSGAAGEDR